MRIAIQRIFRELPGVHDSNSLSDQWDSPAYPGNPTWGAISITTTIDYDDDNDDTTTARGDSGSLDWKN